MNDVWIVAYFSEFFIDDLLRLTLEFLLLVDFIKVEVVTLVHSELLRSLCLLILLLLARLILCD